MSKKVMKLTCSYTNQMECRVCGSVHYAMIRPHSGGRFYRGAWQCINGCRIPDQPADPEPAAGATYHRDCARLREASMALRERCTAPY